MSEDREARRERWADAVHDADEAGQLSYEQAKTIADAALAVADAELSDLRFLFDSARDRADNLADENARLREQLADAQRDHHEDTQQLAEMRETITRLRAELEAAKAVVDRADTNDRETGFFMDVRDALNGERSEPGV
ncbi:hypothetical protein [Streptomyces lycii]|uniref:Cellulose-binding protein n=1 Tax=Streptomyces lycii TaxID=2654337 RepID=A0ABQ7FKY3_9ACTN|nr:hypothetical protein [Streptomyces lycii]KAF4408643.1 hypothetical protein GCU69_13165 [Streptomyces lycii]